MNYLAHLLLGEGTPAFRIGNLLGDFSILERPNSIHVLNAPSPAATASIPIGRSIADKALATFGLEG